MDPHLPIIVTEGEIDAPSLIQVGYPNVWAIGGAQKLDKWLKEIYKINPKIILALDTDDAGINAKMAAYNYCDIEKWKRPLDFWSFCISPTTGKIKDINDINDINDLLVTAPNALKEAINNIKNKFGGQYEKNK
ncbi:MAG: toprim domain-containing protein [Negativicoccus succinicivorans]|nr:toprim domain-containing protein [Negativicoccus succinicivorans]